MKITDFLNLKPETQQAIIDFNSNQVNSNQAKAWTIVFSQCVELGISKWAKEQGLNQLNGVQMVCAFIVWHYNKGKERVEQGKSCENCFYFSKWIEGPDPKHKQKPEENSEGQFICGHCGMISFAHNYCTACGNGKPEKTSQYRLKLEKKPPEKSCDNCDYADVYGGEEPCAHCHNYDNWVKFIEVKP